MARRAKLVVPFFRSRRRYTMLTRRILIAASMAGSMLAAGSAFAQG